VYGAALPFLLSLHYFSKPFSYENETADVEGYRPMMGSGMNGVR
jgi:hypothetical protein